MLTALHTKEEKDMIPLASALRKEGRELKE